MRVFVVLTCLLIAAPAAAQSTSIGVTANWDIARFGRVEIDDIASIVGVPEESLDGEALGFGVSLRRAIGENWGVAFEYGHSGEIENSTRQRVSPLRAGEVFTIPGLPPIGQLPTILPPILNFEYELRTEQQHQSFGALAWVRHEAGDRVDLSYTGGVTFVRSEFEREFTITDPRLAIFLAPQNLSTVEFGVSAAVGIDDDIELTDHTAFTGGVRLQGLGGGRSGWWIRPAVGVRWTF